MARGKIERTALAVAFGAVVERRLGELPRGSKTRLGEHLGLQGGAAGSLVHDLINTRAQLPGGFFADVADFLGIPQSELLAEIAEWLADQDL